MFYKMAKLIDVGLEKRRS